MNELNNILFALLRSAICEESIDTSVCQGIDNDVIGKLYALSKKHDLAHVVGAELEKQGLLTDNSLSQKFGKLQMLAIYRYENQNYELSQIKKTLSEAKIDFLPLKGAVIRDLYPEPWMRTSCDIDVLVKKCDIDRAVELLITELGYERDTKENYHDVSLYSSSGVHLELHFTLEENIPELDATLKCVWDHAAPISEDSCEYRLSNEFFIYHIISHAAYHFVHGGCGVRPLADLWLLIKDGDYDEGKLFELLSESKIDEFSSSMIELSRVWFGKKKHDEMTARMENYILCGGLYGTQEARVAVKREVKGGRIGYLWSRIFVSYDHLRKRYPSLKSRAFAPVYQMRRWFELVFCGGLSRSLKEVEANNSVDQATVDAVSGLMVDLNLKNMIK